MGLAESTFSSSADVYISYLRHRENDNESLELDNYYQLITLFHSCLVDRGFKLCDFGEKIVDLDRDDILGAIDRSKAVIIFLSEKYIKTVTKESESTAKIEYKEALRMKGFHRIVPVIVDESVLRSYTRWYDDLNFDISECACIVDITGGSFEFDEEYRKRKIDKVASLLQNIPSNSIPAAIENNDNDTDIDDNNMNCHDSHSQITDNEKTIDVPEPKNEVKKKKETFKDLVSRNRDETQAMLSLSPVKSSLALYSAYSDDRKNSFLKGALPGLFGGLGFSSSTDGALTHIGRERRKKSVIFDEHDTIIYPEIRPDTPPNMSSNVDDVDMKSKPDDCSTANTLDFFGIYGQMAPAFTSIGLPEPEVIQGSSSSYSALKKFRQTKRAEMKQKKRGEFDQISPLVLSAAKKLQKEHVEQSQIANTSLEDSIGTPIKDSQVVPHSSPHMVTGLMTLSPSAFGISGCDDALEGRAKSEEDCAEEVSGENTNSLIAGEAVVMNSEADNSASWFSPVSFTGSRNDDNPGVSGALTVSGTAEVSSSSSANSDVHRDSPGPRRLALWKPQTSAYVLPTSRLHDQTTSVLSFSADLSISEVRGITAENGSLPNDSNLKRTNQDGDVINFGSIYGDEGAQAEGEVHSGSNVLMSELQKLDHNPSPPPPPSTLESMIGIVGAFFTSSAEQAEVPNQLSQKNKRKPPLSIRKIEPRLKPLRPSSDQAEQIPEPPVILAGVVTLTEEASKRVDRASSQSFFPAGADTGRVRRMAQTLEDRIHSAEAVSSNGSVIRGIASAAIIIIVVVVVVVVAVVVVAVNLIKSKLESIVM